uniref:Uncharacterized protein n=1 Tax=Pristionchus pacificus TaxID=54126 RepID=A0A8R1Z3M8_PRIPA
MYPSWSRVVHILSLSTFLYSHLHFEKDFFFPGFLIFRYYNCCEYESTAISNYITSSNLSVIQSPTAMSICANVESPPEVEEHEGRGHILIIMSDEEDEEPFCNSWNTVTAVAIFKMKKEGGPEWQGQLIAVQTQLLDVDKGLHIGDWPEKLETSVEMRILVESAILAHQRKPFVKIEETNEKEDEKGKDRFKKGNQVKAPEPEEKPTAELNGHGLDEDRLNEKQPQQLHYLWLFSIIPVALLLIGAFSYYRYKQQRNQLLARKTYIKVVYKADDSAGDVQWHESSQSASEEDKSTSSKNNSTSASKSRKSKKRSRSVKEFMHEYFERFSSD